MSVLAVIPARMGSRRLPRKNLLEIEQGLTLVQQAIDCATGSGLVDEVVVSTDETWIPVRDAGLVVRPDAMCGDRVDIAWVVRHAWGTRSVKHDWVVTLQPAVLARSPLIVRTMLEACIARRASAVTMAHTVPWHWRVAEGHADTPWLGLDAGGYPRSQDSPACWGEINAVQIAPAEVVANACRWSLPLLIASLPAWTVALDIDEPGDLATARGLWPWAKHQLETWVPAMHQVDQLHTGGTTVTVMPAADGPTRSPRPLTWMS